MGPAQDRQTAEGISAWLQNPFNENNRSWYQIPPTRQTYTCDRTLLGRVSSPDILRSQALPKLDTGRSKVTFFVIDVSFTPRRPLCVKKGRSFWCNRRFDGRYAGEVKCASYQTSDQSNTAITIAIRIDPQTMDVCLPSATQHHHSLNRGSTPSRRVSLAQRFQTKEPNR